VRGGPGRLGGRDGGRNPRDGQYEGGEGEVAGGSTGLWASSRSARVTAGTTTWAFAGRASPLRKREVALRHTEVGKGRPS
jgi:hypothetical protein